MGWAGLRDLVWVGGEGIMSVVVVHCTPPTSTNTSTTSTTSSSQNYQNTSPVNHREQNWWETIIIIMSLPGTHTGWTDSVWASYFLFTLSVRAQIKMNLYLTEIQFYGFFRLLAKLVLNWKQFYESQRSHNIKI